MDAYWQFHIAVDCSILSGVQKRDIKRGFYHNGIMWHPDKWASVATTFKSRLQHQSASSNRGDSRQGAVADVRFGSARATPSPYPAIVQCAFELVGKAYRELMAQYGEE